MRLVFVHDGPVYYDEVGNFYEYTYHGLYERYSYLADEIIFVMRTQPLIKDEGHTKVPKEIQIVSFKNFKAPMLYFRNKKQVEEIIEKEIRKADIVILRDSSAASIALKYVKKYKIPYIRECVGCVWDSLWNYSLLGKMLAPGCFLRYKTEIKSSPFVCYVTEEFLQRRYPTHGKWISCSNVFIKPIDKKIQQQRMEKIQKFNKDTEIIIGTAAAIDVPFKGQEYVIDAVRILKQNGYKIKYYLAGGNRSGSTYLQDIVKTYNIENDIVFCGSLDAKKMNQFYDSLDIYVQPSKQEGLPRAVIEALSRGCPTIGTRVGGIPELIDEECLFQKGSAKAVAECLVKMICSDLSYYANRNFKKAQNYTIDRLDKKRKLFYDDFLASIKQ